jgi:phosphoglycerol transferase
MVRALCLAGFAGIYVDRRGYPDRAETLLAQLRDSIGPETVASQSGDQLLFALGPVSQRVLSSTDALSLEQERERLMNRACVLCQDGFLRRAPANPPEPWIATHTAVMRLINPGNQTRHVALVMQWRRLGPVENSVAVTGLTIDRQFAPPVEPGLLELEIDLPPGEHLLRFETTPRPVGLARMHPAWCATDVRLIERGKP